MFHFKQNLDDKNDTPVPWREGFWKMGDFRSIILQTSGTNQLIWKNLVSLDYPDIEYQGMILKCQFGRLGKACEEIVAATGVEEYNIEVKGTFVNNMGVLNDEGTKITIFGVSNAVEEWIWMDEDMLKKAKEDRDPFGTPRYEIFIMTSSSLIIFEKVCHFSYL